MINISLKSKIRNNFHIIKKNLKIIKLLNNLKLSILKKIKINNHSHNYYKKENFNNHKKKEMILWILRVTVMLLKVDGKLVWRLQKLQMKLLKDLFFSKDHIPVLDKFF